MHSSIDSVNKAQKAIFHQEKVWQMCMDFRFGTVFLHKYVCFHGEEPRRKSMSSSRALDIISKQLSGFAPMP
jgi:hypothetical protein